MRIALVLILALILVPIVHSMKECGRFTEVKDIPCIQPTSWHPSGNCQDYNATIYLNATEIANKTFSDYLPNCQFTFNYTAPGIYSYNSSIQSGYITIEAEDEMVSLGVIIFLILLNALLFVIPFIIKFTDNEAHNMIIRRSILLTGLALLAFVTTIIITLADNSALGITKELFFFQWVFVKGIYIGMILLIFSMFVSFPKMIQAQKERKRMGEE